MTKRGLRQWFQHISTLGRRLKRNGTSSKLLEWVKPVSLKPTFSSPSTKKNEVTGIKLKNFKPIEEILPDNLTQAGLFAPHRSPGMGSCSFMDGAIQPTTRRGQKVDLPTSVSLALPQQDSLMNRKTNVKMLPMDGPLSSLHASRMSAACKRTSRINEASFNRLILYKRFTPKK